MSEIGDSDCFICHGTRRVLVGMSFPPRKTIAVHFEYEPCPECTQGQHSFHARRQAQILREMRERLP